MRMPFPLRLLLQLAVLSFGMAAAAAAGPLNGHVQSNSLPVVGATINAIDAANEEVVGSAETDDNGNYSIPLGAGFYNIEVLPPPDSNLNGTTVTNFEVLVGPTTLNFVLVAPTNATFSGTLFDMGGVTGMANQTVQLIQAGGETGQTALTDGSGHFSFNVQTGSYFLLVSGDNQGFTLQAPDGYIIQTAPFEITGTTALDFTLPVHPVNVHVQRENSQPVGNAGLSSTSALNCALQFGSITSCGVSFYDFDALAPPNATTHANGDVTLYLFPTPPSQEFLYSLTATPPDGENLAPGTASGIIVTGETPVTITLMAPTILTGRLLDGATPAAGIPAQSLVLTPDGQEEGIAGTTGAGGDFTFAVEPGTYRLSVFGDNQGFTAAAPQAYSLNSGPIAIGASQNTDFPLPVRRVDVHVQTADNEAVEGVGITTTSVNNCELVFGPTTACGASGYVFLGSPGEPVTDVDGNITLWLFPTPATPDPSIESTYRFTAFPPSGSGQAPTTVSDIEISATNPNLVTITLAAPVSFSGTLSDANGAGIPNQFLELVPDAPGPSVNVQTGLDGSYGFAVQAGTYRLNILGDNQNFASAAPQFYMLTSDPFVISGNQVANLTVPANTIAVHVQDTQTPTAADVPNVGFTVFGPTSCGLATGGLTFCGSSQYFYVRPPAGDPPPATGVTDANGDLSLYLFRTPTPPEGDDPQGYSITASPLADSGYEEATVTSVVVDGNFPLVIVLPAVHLAPVTTLTISPPADGNGRYPDPATITLTATAAIGFTIDVTLYEVDGGGLQQYAGPFDVGVPGSHTVTYFSIDSSGLAEAPNTFDFEIAFPDPIPPTTTATVSPAPNAAGWNKADVMVTLNAVDNPGGSGVDKITYSISGAQSAPPTDVLDDTASFPITAEGISVVTFYATDVAGNVEAPQTLTVRIDKTAPELYSRFDPAALDILVFGRDGGAGVPASPIVPTVVPGPSGIEFRTYVVEDAAGNTLTASITVTRAQKQIDATITSLQYNTAAPITPVTNTQSHNWELQDGSLKDLKQVVAASPAVVQANFGPPHNETKISLLSPPPATHIYRPGLVLIRLATSQGALGIEF